MVKRDVIRRLLLPIVLYGVHSSAAKLKLASEAEIATSNNSDTEMQAFELHRACEAVDFELIQRLIKDGVDVNAMDDGDKTPLMYASGRETLSTSPMLTAPNDSFDEEWGSLECRKAIIMHLIGNKALPNLANGDGLVPLHFACQAGSAAIVKQLIDCKANVNCKDNFGNNGLTTLLLSEQLSDVYDQPMRNDVSNKWIKTIQLLIANGIDINSPNKDGSTPLITAAKAGRLDLVACLAEAGANIDQETNDKLTALIHAASAGYTNIVEYLLGRGALVDLADDVGFSALHHACYYGHVDIVRLLTDYKANVNSSSNSKNTPLHSLIVSEELLRLNANGATGINEGRAKKYRWKSIFDILVANGAKLDLFNYDDDNPLSIAVKGDQFYFVKQLVEAGANIDIQSSKGFTALSCAAFMNRYEMMEYFLNRGASVDLKTSSGHLPLHYACFNGAADAVKLLISFKSNINQQDNNGNTPLNLAIYGWKRIIEPESKIFYYENWSNVLDYLLAGGADANISNHNGNGPLMIAIKVDRLDFVKRLLKFKANINCQNGKKMSPLHVAAFREQKSIVACLLSRGALTIVADGNGFTPLHEACQIGSADIAKLLLECKADANAQTNMGDTPLNSLLLSRKLSSSSIPGVSLNTESCPDKWLLLVRLLISNRASLDAVDRHGDLPLIIASRMGRLDMVKSLVEGGAQIHKQSLNRLTALAEAALIDQRRIVEYLLSQPFPTCSYDSDCANPNGGGSDYFVFFLNALSVEKIQSDEGRAYLTLAIWNNQLKLAKFLLDSGALASRERRGNGLLRKPSLLELLGAYMSDSIKQNVYTYCIQPKRIDKHVSMERTFLSKWWKFSETLVGASDRIGVKDTGADLDSLSLDALCMYMAFARRMYKAFSVFSETLEPLSKSLGISDLKFIIYLFETARSYLNSRCQNAFTAFNTKHVDLLSVFELVFSNDNYAELAYLVNGVVKILHKLLKNDPKERGKILNWLVTGLGFLIRPYFQTPEHLVDLINWM